MAPRRSKKTAKGPDKDPTTNLETPKRNDKTQVPNYMRATSASVKRSTEKERKMSVNSTVDTPTKKVTSDTRGNSSAILHDPPSVPKNLGEGEEKTKGNNSEEKEHSEAPAASMSAIKEDERVNSDQPTPANEQQETTIPKWAKANLLLSRFIMQALQINLLKRFDSKEVLEAVDFVHEQLCAASQNNPELSNYTTKWQNLRYAERWESNQPEIVDQDTRILRELEIIKNNIKLIRTSQAGATKQQHNTEPIQNPTANMGVTPERPFASLFDSNKSLSHVMHMTPPPPQPVTRKEDRRITVVPSQEDKDKQNGNFDRFTFTKTVNEVLQTLSNDKQDFVESCHRLPSGDISLYFQNTTTRNQFVDKAAAWLPKLFSKAHLSKRQSKFGIVVSHVPTRNNPKKLAYDYFQDLKTKYPSLSVTSTKWLHAAGRKKARTSLIVFFDSAQSVDYFLKEKRIVMGDEIFAVNDRYYIPKIPSPCRKCFHYNHRTEQHQGPNLCGLCADTLHLTEDCPHFDASNISNIDFSKVQCGNCGEKHLAWSRLCKHYHEAYHNLNSPFNRDQETASSNHGTAALR
jgi:hypothetical protein